MLDVAKTLDLSGWRKDEIYDLAIALSKSIGQNNPYCLQYDSYRSSYGSFPVWFSTRNVVLYLLEHIQQMVDNEIIAKASQAAREAMREHYGPHPFDALVQN